MTPPTARCGRSTAPVTAGGEGGPPGSTWRGGGSLLGFSYPPHNTLIALYKTFKARWGEGEGRGAGIMRRIMKAIALFSSC